ncbi:hypothetical protein WMY93_014886 [Mugilogobius chulae]|uniref:NAD(P)(+)--arginine ADP-ribosyltransferase n=1 Tax=Mugilogobius chulae TaxID=88201 RepID=A0AAW0NW85_9GOBI
MMEESVDDMFSHCVEEMANKVQEVYFPREIKESDFETDWQKSEDCTYESFVRLLDEDKALTKDHLQAICVYADKWPYLPATETLNEALSLGARNYSTPAFQYHASYYWLTTAVQHLQHLRKSCETAYRRSDLVYEGEEKQIIRFGFFASSSRSPNMVGFGEETCFHIKTCLGAHIGYYTNDSSIYEVLIPPYEKFKVIKILSGTPLDPFVSYGYLRRCNKIFVLESVGSESRLNYVILFERCKTNLPTGTNKVT